MPLCNRNCKRGTNAPVATETAREVRILLLQHKVREIRMLPCNKNSPYARHECSFRNTSYIVRNTQTAPVAAAAAAAVHESCVNALAATGDPRTEGAVPRMFWHSHWHSPTFLFNFSNLRAGAERCRPFPQRHICSSFINWSIDILFLWTLKHITFN